MLLILTQNSFGLILPQPLTITGWNQADETDHAQSNGMGGYGPCLSSYVEGGFNELQRARRLPRLHEL